MEAISRAYPEYITGSLSQMPYGYWKDIDNQRRFLDNAFVKLKMQKPEDWYAVRIETILKMGGGWIFSIYGTLINGTELYFSNI
jgi:hypothetical protein